MKEKTSDKKEKKEPSNAQRIALEYMKSPVLLTRTLADVFSVVDNEQEMGVHNDRVEEICLIVGEGLPKVLEKIAYVILENTVVNEISK